MQSEEALVPDAPLRKFVDLVCCVDVSPAMSDLLPSIRGLLFRWISEFPERALERGFPLESVRLRVIPFTSGDAQPPSTAFMTLASHDGRLRGKGLNSPRDLAEALERSIKINPGDATAPRALEALEAAMGSDWIRETGKWQHIVVLVTDTAPALIQPGQKDGNPRESILDRLTDLWAECTDFRMTPWSRRLMLIAPDTHPWDAIADSWVMTVWLPSRVDGGLPAEVDVLFELVLNSWL